MLDVVLILIYALEIVIGGLLLALVIAAFRGHNRR